MVASRGYEILSAEEVEEVCYPSDINTGRTGGVSTALLRASMGTIVLSNHPLLGATRATRSLHNHPLLLLERTVLSSRVGALQKKRATKVKIRDAAQTLVRLNATSSSPSHLSRQMSNTLDR